MREKSHDKSKTRKALLGHRSLVYIALAMASRKRAYDEFDVSDMQVSKSAKVHGLVASLSPMKSNVSGTTKYFEGRLTDKKGSRRVVGFDAKIHKKLLEFHESHESVAVDNCEIKEGRKGSGLEVVIRNGSVLQTSPTKFDVSKPCSQV